MSHAKQFQYKLIQNNRYTYSDIEEFLNDMGKCGWELSHIKNGDTINEYYIFKRELK